MLRPSDRTLREQGGTYMAVRSRVGRKTVKKKPAAKRPAAKKTTARGAAASPPKAKRAHAKRIRERLHTAIRRAPQTVSEREFEEATAAVLVIVAELAAETAEVFGELLTRIERIEARLGR
jgi:hypothetical protein